MECIKNCCKTFMKKKGQEQETPGKRPFSTAAYHTAFNTVCVSLNYFSSFVVIALKIPPNNAAASGQKLAEDYLLSKLPPDGREVPFVIPTFKASYIQPSYPNLQAEPHSMYLH